MACGGKSRAELAGTKEWIIIMAAGALWGCARNWPRP